MTEDIVFFILGLLGVLALLLFVSLPVATVVMLRGVRRQLRALQERMDAWHADADTPSSGKAVERKTTVAPEAMRTPESRPESSSTESVSVSSAPPPLPPLATPSVPAPLSADLSDSRFGLAPCRLARQGPEIGVEGRVFPPQSPVPATQGRGGRHHNAKGWADLPASEPRVRNAFEEKALQALRGIWNWIVVGEEYRRPGVSLEFAVASNWLLRAGVVATVFGMVFFLRHAAERGMLNPQVRVALTLLAGAGMIAGGIRLLGRAYHLLAQGLMGAGLATLYAAVFAAANLFHLVSMGTAFALMFAVTVAAGAMSVRFDSMLMALLGILGGYGTPVLLSTGSANFTGLFSYMLFLGLGVLGIAHRKQWRLLVFLAFLATAILAQTAIAAHYEPADFWRVLPFLAAFFVLYSTTTFVYQMCRRQPSTMLDLCLLVLNATAFFGLAYGIMAESGLRDRAALLSLPLAAFYTAHAYGFLRRPFRDRGLILSFIALAGFFAAITIPIHFSRDWYAASWSLQALLMLWLAGKLRSRFLQQVAYALYLIVFVRFLFFDLHPAFGSALRNGLSAGAYAWALVERLAQFGVPIACMAGAFRLLRKPAAPSTLSLEEDNDIRGGLEPAWSAPIAFAFLFLMTFVWLHLELNRGTGLFFNPVRLPALTLLWVLAWGVLLTWRKACPQGLRHVLMAGLAIGLFVKWLHVDLAGWDVSWSLGRYARSDALEAGMRALDWACVIGFCLYAFRLLRRDPERAGAGRAFGYVALTLLFLYTSLELNTWMHVRVPGLRSGGLSVYWGLFALSLVVGGMTKRVRPLRFVGLGLFATVALRVFFLDLNRLDPVFRIGAFLVLGLVLMTGAFVYLKFSAVFTESDDNFKRADTQP